MACQTKREHKYLAKIYPSLEIRHQVLKTSWFTQIHNIFAAKRLDFPKTMSFPQTPGCAAWTLGMMVSLFLPLADPSLGYFGWKFRAAKIYEAPMAPMGEDYPENHQPREGWLDNDETKATAITSSLRWPLHVGKEKTLIHPPHHSCSTRSRIIPSLPWGKSPNISKYHIFPRCFAFGAWKEVDI